MAAGIDSRPQRRAVIIADSVGYRFSQSLLILLAFCFGLQVFSPLRLNTNAIVLLSMADSAAHGGGFFDNGQTVFPPGYPALLAVLMRAGLAHPWTIVGMNAAFLSVGLFAAYSLLIREFFANKSVALIICSFFLLSFVVVKHFTIPLTDVPFFCCSMCCLAVMSRTMKMDWNWQFVILAVAAWLLAVAAITVRRVGVALFPPSVFMIVCSPHFKSLLKCLSRRAKLIIVVISIFVGIVTVYVVAKTSTLSDFIGVAKESKISTLVLQNLSYRLTEFGELLVNLPMSKMPTKVHFMVPWIGLLLLLLTLIGLATKLKEVGPTEVFLVCYIGILFAWPFHDVKILVASHSSPNCLFSIGG
jgi:hypothetical protein